MMIETRLRPHVALGAAVAVAAAILLSACAPSPTTTTTDAEGNTVTVDWVDYPAHAGIPANDVLMLPDAEEVEARADELIAEVQDILIGRTRP